MVADLLNAAETSPLIEQLARSVSPMCSFQKKTGYQKQWLRSCLVFSLIAPLISGCETTLGSETLRTARPAYNDAVADTGRQQTLANIVRVHHNQTPVIIEIAEIDDISSLSGGVNGGVTGVGAGTGYVGAAGGSLTYNSNPTLRLIPLQGQQLIQQISTPITVETLGNLFDSDWPLASILTFAVDRLTPGYDDYGVALNQLIALDDAGVLVLAASKSDYDVAKLSAADKTKKADSDTSASPSDTLNVYFNPKSPYRRGGRNNSNELQSLRREWSELIDLYQGTQPSRFGTTENNNADASRLELRIAPRLGRGLAVARLGAENLAPVIRTRSALGILKALVERPRENVDFITPQDYAEIRSANRNKQAYLDRCESEKFYVLSIDEAKRFKGLTLDALGGEKGSVPMAVNNVLKEMDRPESSQCLYSVAQQTHTINADAENLLKELREFIIVIQSEGMPSEAYAKWYDQGLWFWIAQDDDISQKNLVLLNQFLTIQATQTPAATVTAISVGGTR